MFDQTMFWEHVKVAAMKKLDLMADNDSLEKWAALMPALRKPMVNALKPLVQSGAIKNMSQEEINNIVQGKYKSLANTAGGSAMDSPLAGKPVAGAPLPGGSERGNMLAGMGRRQRIGEMQGDKLGSFQLKTAAEDFFRTMMARRGPTDIGETAAEMIAREGGEAAPSFMKTLAKAAPIGAAVGGAGLSLVEALHMIGNAIGGTGAF